MYTLTHTHTHRKRRVQTLTYMDTVAVLTEVVEADVEVGGKTVATAAHR